MSLFQDYFKRKQQERKQKYENYYLKTKEAKEEVFTNDLQLFQYKTYHYSKLAVIVANHLNEEAFSQTRQSFQLCLALPIVLMVGFNVVAPFSFIRKPCILGGIMATQILLAVNFKQDLIEEARKDTPFSALIRERMKKLAIYDSFELAMRDYTLKYSQHPQRKQLEEEKENVQKES